MKRWIRPTAVALIGIALLAGCDGDGGSGAQEQGQSDTETAFKQQAQAVPYPKEQLRDSLERRNIKERLLRTNKPNAIGYVYLLSKMGMPYGYYVIKGKVSSTQSQMTTEDLIEHCHYNDSSCPVVAAPGDDGSYGQNEDGIFFFTTDGAMVETNADYIVSDQPLAVDVPKMTK